MTCEEELEIYKDLVKKYRFDYLTGFKQRKDFIKETESKMERQQFYLLMTDVIGLHNVNRNQGYQAGDELIKQVSNDLKQVDYIWENYRIGGDEFMSILFDEPKCVCIDNATTAYVKSTEYKNLNDMIKAVDKLVTEKKVKLNRRRN